MSRLLVRDVGISQLMGLRGLISTTPVYSIRSLRSKTFVERILFAAPNHKLMFALYIHAKQLETNYELN